MYEGKPAKKLLKENADIQETGFLMLEKKFKFTPNY
jgi:hypothetical protein